MGFKFLFEDLHHRGAFLNICAHNYVISEPNCLKFYRHINIYIQSRSSALFNNSVEIFPDMSTLMKFSQFYEFE